MYDPLPVEYISGQYI